MCVINSVMIEYSASSTAVLLSLFDKLNIPVYAVRTPLEEQANIDLQQWGSIGIEVGETNEVW